MSAVNEQIRFLDTYKSRGVDFWGMTTQNEPINGFLPLFPINALAFSPAQQRDWIKMDLGS